MGMMKRLVILLAFFTFVVSLKLEDSPGPSSNTKTTGRCVEYGIGYNGDWNVDVVYNIGHWADCAYLCQGHRGCNYWTWDQKHGGKMCYLTSSSAGRHYAKEGMSGTYNCLSEC